MREYDLISTWFAENRSDEVGIPGLERLTAPLQTGARILDVGCGNGRPISMWLLNKGYVVTGIDSSASMLTSYKQNCPEATAIKGQIETWEFHPDSYEAVVAWGVIFHLLPLEQIAALRTIGSLLCDGGRLLFTAAREEGLATGEMGGVTFEYRSLGRPAYVRVLREAGLVLLEDRLDAWGNYCYLAEKRH